MPLRGAVLLALCASLAVVPAAHAAPDSTTGGVEVPDSPTGGTEGGAVLPQAGEATPEAEPPARERGPAVSASRAGVAQTPSQSQNGEEGDVEVEVPVPPAQPAPTSPPPSSTPVGGLASTGFAAGVLGLLGLVFGALGLTLLRLSAPARLRRRAQRRAASHRGGRPASLAGHIRTR